MSRITFIENRGKTVFWAAVAKQLAAAGHVVSWIVQNKAYRPHVKGQKIIVLPVPAARDLQDIGIPDAVSTDRGRTYFGSGHLHYAHYQRHIASALETLKPDVVIGEPTLFHELLAIAACQTAGIPYLHPTMNRYPAQQFSILDADTQVPAVRSGDIWDASAIDALAQAVCSDAIQPSYMKIPKRRALWARRGRLIAGQMRTIAGRLAGEQYNTPSVLRKLQLQRSLKANLMQWDALAHGPAPNGPVILYPLQMQPEANIDVWGRPYSDQIAVIKALAAALPANGQVAVKANPKSKYEVSDALMSLARQDPRVVLLPQAWTMAQAKDASTGTVTISGTVGYEAIFGRNRCLSLRHPVIDTHFADFAAQTPAQAVALLLSDPDIGRGNMGLTKAFLRILVADSFAGVISEPTYDPDCVSLENITQVTKAITQAVAAVTQRTPS